MFLAKGTSTYLGYVCICAEKYIKKAAALQTGCDFLQIRLRNIELGRKK